MVWLMVFAVDRYILKSSCSVLSCVLYCDLKWLLMIVSIPFQYIQQNIRSDCSNIEKIMEPPEGQDEGVWKYEHLRYINSINVNSDPSFYL